MAPSTTILELLVVVHVVRSMVRGLVVLILVAVIVALVVTARRHLSAHLPVLTIVTELVLRFNSIVRLVGHVIQAIFFNLWFTAS
jgi:predicted membrane protein